MANLLHQASWELVLISVIGLIASYLSNTPYQTYYTKAIIAILITHIHHLILIVGYCPP
jgi:hypothetical protein